MNALKVFALAAGALFVAACASRYHEPPTGAPPPPREAPAPFSGLKVVNGEPYADMYFHHYGVNPTIDTAEEPISTFSVDVDTASYTLARSYLDRGHLPDGAAVRVEEFINAFSYAYEDPKASILSVATEGFPSPSRPGYHLLKLGLRAKDVTAAERAPALLVFTIDTSGSMGMENRIGLVQRSLKLLLTSLSAQDQVAVVTYGAGAQVVLPPTPASHRSFIEAAIDGLALSGSTNVQAGLKLAYALAAEAPASMNRRVILCSDGVANSGLRTDADGIYESVQAHARQGVRLTTVGFGMGNYNDVLMEKLAQRGDGQYAYVDRLAEARRLFVEQATGTLQLVARDVKLQVAFDPEVVDRYRLLGYENRLLAKEDFADDRVDAGDLGAGHTVTALYEVKLRAPDPSRVAKPLATLRIRYKEPRDPEAMGALFEAPLSAASLRPRYEDATPDARLAFVVAQFAEKLRGSYWVRHVKWPELRARYEALPQAVRARPEVTELGALLARAAKLDARPDRFAKDVPAEGMDFDDVPVVRK